MFRIDDKKILEFQDDLTTFKRRALPFATKSTLNSAAFTARRFAQENIRNNMIERNKFTVASVRVEQARTLDISQQSSVVGSVAGYMEDQEFGGTKTSKGKHGVPLPTSYSAGQAMGAQPRTRLPRKPNTLGAIQLSRRRSKGVSRAQQNKAAVMHAAQSGAKFVFLDLGKTKGIFRVLGGKRKPRIKMVWSMAERAVPTPKNPWLLPAVRRTENEIPRLYADALRFQLKKHGLFRQR